LLPLFGFPLCIAFAFLFIRFGRIAHAIIHPALDASSAGEFLHGPIRLATALIIFPSLIASVFPAFMLTNLCSGQLTPDTGLSFFSATAGASPSLN